MLLELSVHNIALIESLRLTLYPGLSVLTGETGAGKSILIDSLGLVLGGRADRSLVRAGADKAVVEALFDITQSPAACALLDEWGIDASEGTAVVVRELSSAGRSICRISGTLVTATQLKSLCGLLVDLHGQHEHQRLLDRSSHRAWVDLFAGTALLEERVRCAAQHEAWRSVRREIESIGGSAQERERRADMLRYQIEEIASARLTAGEWDELSVRRNRLRHAERIAEQVQAAWAKVWQGDGRAPSARDLLAGAASALHQVADLDSELAEAAQKIEEVSYALEDAAEGLRGLLTLAESDPRELERVEDRVELIAQLRRKYGGTSRDPAQDILAFYARASEELNALEHSEETLGLLCKREAELRAALAGSCAALSAMRRAAGTRMAGEIAAVLCDLGMEKTRVEIRVDSPEDPDEARFSPEGWDAVEMLIAPNPGEPMKPLADIASGGEISRVMLALKSIGAQQGDVGTMIFDEIDTGVSGRIAHAVAEKMADIAKTRQVLCVTHLPQIAAMGAHHYRVEKRETSGRTETHVVPLDAEGRVLELARIVGGQETVSDTAAQHARSILAAGRDYREGSKGAASKST